MPHKCTLQVSPVLLVNQVIPLTRDIPPLHTQKHTQTQCFVNELVSGQRKIKRLLILCVTTRLNEQQLGCLPSWEKESVRESRKWLDVEESEKKITAGVWREREAEKGEREWKGERGCHPLMTLTKPKPALSQRLSTWRWLLTSAAASGDEIGRNKTNQMWSIFTSCRPVSPCESKGRIEGDRKCGWKLDGAPVHHALKTNRPQSVLCAWRCCASQPETTETEREGRGRAGKERETEMERRK